MGWPNDAFAPPFGAILPGKACCANAWCAPRTRLIQGAGMGRLVSIHRCGACRPRQRARIIGYIDDFKLPVVMTLLALLLRSFLKTAERRRVRATIARTALNEAYDRLLLIACFPILRISQCSSLASSRF